MKIPSLSPEPISNQKRKKIYQNKLFVWSFLGFLFTSLIVWLIIARFARNPFDKVDSLLIEKKISQAAELNFKLMKKFPEHRLALLMNGTVINYGLRELNITDTRLPYYEYENYLAKEDKTGVFTRQSFLKKFSIFPDSAHFLDEFCRFNLSYPQSLKNPEVSVIIQRGLHSKTLWNKVSDECIKDLLHTEDSAGMVAKVVGDNLSIREKPSSKSKLLGRLKRNELLLIKNKGAEETIGNKKGNWYFVLNENQIYGWVFGGYLEKQ